MGFALSTLAPRTLRSRLAFTFTGLVVAVLAALGIYLASGARQLYVDRLADQLAAQAQLVAAAAAPSLAAGGGVAEIDPLVKRLGAQIDARVTVIAPDGTVLGDSVADPRAMENHADRPEVVAARTAGVGKTQRRSGTLDTAFLYVAVPIMGTPDAAARVALPLDEVNAAVRRIQRDVGAAAAIAAALAAVVAVLIAARITEPLDALRRQVRAVAAGSLDAAVRPAPTRELGDVGRAFNAMTADLRRLAAEQRRTRDRLEATLANLNDGVVITDETGAVVRLNGAAERILGVMSEAAVGRPFIVASRDHDLADLLQEALATGEPRAATVAYTHGRRVLEVSARSVRSGGERIGLVVLRDVTELRRLEGVRREFVANVSHELRTPLASIKALAETLQAGARDDPAVADEFLGRITGEVDYLTALVDELLDLARLEAGRITLRRRCAIRPTCCREPSSDCDRRPSARVWRCGSRSRRGCPRSGWIGRVSSR